MARSMIGGADGARVHPDQDIVPAPRGRGTCSIRTVPEPRSRRWTAARLGRPPRTDRQDGDDHDADWGFVAFGYPAYGSDAAVPLPEPPAGILRKSPMDRRPT